MNNSAVAVLLYFLIVGAAIALKVFLCIRIWRVGHEKGYGNLTILFLMLGIFESSVIMTIVLSCLPDKSSPAQEIPNNDGSRKCPSCGGKIYPGTYICPTCGSRQ